MPLFDEHVGEDGVYYDEALLRQIAQNQNDRIADTGDYVPVVQWHTKEDGAPDEDPPLVGYAGPFFVAPYGHTKPRPCIYARKIYVYKDKERIYRRRPRRSVEMWPEKDPKDRFFDPIALLGAETPKRDLGMSLTYSRSAGDRMRYCRAISYQATTPVGGNTFVAGTGDRERRRNQKDSTMNDQAAAVVQGMQPILENFAKELRYEFNKRLGVIEDQLGIGAAAEGVPTGDVDPAGGPPPATLQTEVPPGVDDLSAGPPEAGGEPPMEGPPAPMEGTPPGAGPEEEYDPEFAGAMAGRFNKRYAMGGDSPDMLGATAYMKAMDSSDRYMMDRYMKDSDDEDLKGMYAKACGKSSDHYSKVSESVLRYERERDDISVKYRKSETARLEAERKLVDSAQQLFDVSHELEDKAKQSTRDRREVILHQKSAVGVSFKMEEELPRVEAMTDEEFERHVEPGGSMDNYPRVSSGEFLPNDRDGEVQGPITPETEQKSYGKRASDIVQQYRKRGRELSQMDVCLDMEKRNSGEFDIDKFDARNVPGN